MVPAAQSRPPHPLLDNSSIAFSALMSLDQGRHHPEACALTFPNQTHSQDRKWEISIISLIVMYCAMASVMFWVNQAPYHQDLTSKTSPWYQDISMATAAVKKRRTSVYEDLDLALDLLEQTETTVLQPLAFFVSWHGVLTLAYRWRIFPLAYDE